jgi:hypothetical protein
MSDPKSAPLPGPTPNSHPARPTAGAEINPSEKMKWTGWSCSVFFILLLILVSLGVPNPTPFQYHLFTVTLAICAAGFVAFVPGFLFANLFSKSQLFRASIQGGGAVVAFLVVFFFMPVALQNTIAPKFKVQTIPDLSADRLQHANEYRQAAERFLKQGDELSTLDLLGKISDLAPNDAALQEFCDLTLDKIIDVASQKVSRLASTGTVVAIENHLITFQVLEVAARNDPNVHKLQEACDHLNEAKVDHGLASNDPEQINDVAMSDKVPEYRTQTRKAAISDLDVCQSVQWELERWHREIQRNPEESIDDRDIKERCQQMVSVIRPNQLPGIKEKARTILTEFALVFPTNQDVIALNRQFERVFSRDKAIGKLAGQIAE